MQKVLKLEDGVPAYGYQKSLRSSGNAVNKASHELDGLAAQREVEEVRRQTRLFAHQLSDLQRAYLDQGLRALIRESSRAISGEQKCTAQAQLSEVLAIRRMFREQLALRKLRSSWSQKLMSLLRFKVSPSS